MKMPGLTIKHQTELKISFLLSFDKSILIAGNLPLQSFEQGEGDLEGAEQHTAKHFSLRMACILNCVNIKYLRKLVSTSEGASVSNAQVFGIS